MADLVPLSPALPGLDLRLLDAAARAMAPATRRALRADIRIWTAWAAPRGIGQPPLSPHDVADFLRDMGTEGRKAATLARYMSSIATWHRLLDLPDPTRAELVRLELKAQRRALGVRQRQAAGLRFKGEVADPLAGVGAVGACVEAMLLACPETIAGVRNRALLSLAYDTGLRRSELIEVRWPHIERGSAGAGRLFVPRTKTDREGAGAYAFLSARTMQALAHWAETGGGREGAVFCRLHRSERRDGTVSFTVGAQLTPQSVNLIYRAMLDRARTDGLLEVLSEPEFEAFRAGLSAHSTRVGLTQDLFAAGQDLGGIMQALRWKSPSQPARYAQALAVEANAAAKVVGKL